MSRRAVYRTDQSDALVASVRSSLPSGCRSLFTHMKSFPDFLRVSRCIIGRSKVTKGQPKVAPLPMASQWFPMPILRCPAPFGIDRRPLKALRIFKASFVLWQAIIHRYTINAIRVDCFAKLAIGASPPWNPQQGFRPCTPSRFRSVLTQEQSTGLFLRSDRSGP